MSSTPPNASAPPTFSLLPAGASSATTLNPAIAIDTTATAPSASAPHSASSEYGPPSPAGSAEPFAPKSSLGLRDNVDVSSSTFYIPLLHARLPASSIQHDRILVQLFRGALEFDPSPLRVRAWRSLAIAQRGKQTSRMVTLDGASLDLAEALAHTRTPKQVHPARSRRIFREPQSVSGRGF